MSHEDKNASEENFDVNELFDEPSDNSKGTPENNSEKKDENKEEMVPISRLKSAEQKISELGDNKARNEEWFKDNKNWLDPIVANPEIAEALRTGKLDGDLAKGILEGKVTLEEAKAVTKATEDVKKEVGTEKFEGMSAEAASKLVEAEVAKQFISLQKDVDSRFSKQALEDSAVKENSNFIADTPDFADYADDVNQWLDKHSDVWKLEDAYHAVKGRRMTDTEAKKRAEEVAEEKKRLASNAGGGTSEAGAIANNSMIDAIFSGNDDANVQ